MIKTKIPTRSVILTRAVRRDMEKLRARSGTIRMHSKLVSFLYELMRDKITPGDVEGILLNSKDPDVTYCNGWLALYAQDVANRLLK